MIAIGTVPIVLRSLQSPSAPFAALSASLAAGYGVLFTVVGDYREAYGISETAIGLLIGSGFLAAFVAQVFIAPVADRGRARQLVMIGVVANVAGLVMMAFGETMLVLTAGRVISGVGIGAASPAIRRIVILADPENLGQNLGRLLSADVFGFALGPAISAVLVGPFGLRAPFLVVAAATMLFVALAWRFRVIETVEESSQRLALDLLRNKAVAAAVVLGSGAFVMIGAFDALWDVVHEDLDTPTWMANLGITLFAIPLVILGPTGGRLAQRLGPFRVAATGLLLGAAFMFTYGQLPSGSWIFGVSLFHALTDGLTIAAAGVAVAIAVPEERQAGAHGVLGAAQSLMAGITAIAIGSVYDQAGRAAAYGVAAIGMLVTIAVGLVLASEFRTKGTVAVT